MSKWASPYLRLALWQAAFMATQHDPQLRDFYQRKRAEGKAHGTAVGAVCRKLLHSIYVVLKAERPFLKSRCNLENLLSIQVHLPFATPAPVLQCADQFHPIPNIQETCMVDRNQEKHHSTNGRFPTHSHPQKIKIQEPRP